MRFVCRRAELVIGLMALGNSQVQARCFAWQTGAADKEEEKALPASWGMGVRL